MPFNRILWSTDFSELSYAALEVAKDLAVKYSAELWIVHVLVPVPGVSTTSTFDVARYDQERTAQVKENIDHLVNDLKTRELPIQVRTVIKGGEPADEIVKLVRAEEIDLIVTATHARKGLSHFVFGSVAEKIVKLAPCPVLVTRSSQQIK
jgi:nucleotide-binding universal stress UspA family protein